MIKEIIFDCFGVLTEDGWLAFMNTFATSENAEDLRYCNYQIDRGLMTYDDFLQRVSELSGATKEEAHATITANHHPNKPLFDYIRTLQERGYDLGIISNVGSELSEFLPAHYLEAFEHITLSYQVGVGKPDARIYKTHLEKSGHHPNEVIFIDDREANCHGAAQLGIQAIHYKDATQTRTELETLLAS